MSALSWPILGQTTGGSSGEHHLDFKPVDTSKTEDALRAAETACRLAIQQIPQEVEVSQELLIYPEGEGDAVTITERDMAELQPGKFLGNNIVDFYIRFLERRLPPEHGKRFHFFNSFFFQKLLQSTAPTRIDPCKVDYEQLRRWTEKVNLFEKDYVLIPILKSSHWSLVIICHLSSLTRASDEMTRFPCIVHLDPIEGQHESFEGLIRSYVLQAWMERFQPSIDRDLLLALHQMKYVQAKVPQQHNSHDCGLYVLNYIEAFLVESTSPNFSFASSERGPHFTSPHFAREVLAKQSHIHNLILELSCISKERTRKCKARWNLLQELIQISQKLRACLADEGTFGASIQDVMTIGPTIFNGQGCAIDYIAIHKDSMYAQHQSRGNEKPLGGSEIGHVEYENGYESLSPKQQYVELEVQVIGSLNFKGPIFETKHESIHQDAIEVQHPQSSGILRLDHDSLNGLEHQHDKFQTITEGTLDEHQHVELEDMPCMELFGVLKGKNKRGRNMTKEETSMLLSCKVQRGRFCKGSGDATNWNLISEEIGKKLGSLPSADQCRLRYDTLLKAYKTYKKYCMKTGKMFSMITEAERLDLKLATTLSEEWYAIMDEICDNVSQKRMKLNSNVCNDLNQLNSLDLSTSNPLPLISQENSCNNGAVVLDSACGNVEVALCNVIPMKVFNSLNEDLQSTLLNLVQECSMRDCIPRWWIGKIFSLEDACRRLVILQDREPREILNYVFKLWELKLVNVLGMVFEEGHDLVDIDLWKGKIWFFKLGLYKKITKEVLCKNLQLKTYCTSFPMSEQPSLQFIRVLSLHGGSKVEHLDLRGLPNLQSLVLRNCRRFKLVTSWEVAKSLGSLEIRCCYAYHDFPHVQYLFSLREIWLREQTSKKSTILWQLSQFSQCTKLQRLRIEVDNSLCEVANLDSLKGLKFLEFLSFGGCPISSIQGLSGLQALTTLNLCGCRSLKRVPDLGCLKGLTYLDMSSSGINDVVGVEELHLLTWLDLNWCYSLKWLPFLGHLKALVYLNLESSGVKEIPGREGLISLKTLRWHLQ